MEGRFTKNIEKINFLFLKNVVLFSAKPRNGGAKRSVFFSSIF